MERIYFDISVSSRMCEINRRGGNLVGKADLCLTCSNLPGMSILQPPLARHQSTAEMFWV